MENTYQFEEDKKLEEVRKEEAERGKKMASELLLNMGSDLIQAKFEPNGSDVLKGREAFFKSMSERFGKDFEPYKE